MAGKPSLSLSCRCPLTSRPDWSQRYMPGARCSAISTTFATQPFGSGIRGKVRHAPIGQHAGNIDDHSSLARDHSGQNGLHGEEVSSHIGVEDAIKNFRRRVQDGAPLSRAGAVTQNVDGTQGRHRTFDCGANRGRIGQIAVCAKHFCAERLQLCPRSRVAGPCDGVFRHGLAHRFGKSSD